MTEAPSVIWAVTEPNDISADILGDVYAQQIPDGMVGTPVKYIRADLVSQIKAQVWAEAIEAAIQQIADAGYYCVPTYDETGNLAEQIDHSMEAVCNIPNPYEVAE